MSRSTCARGGLASCSNRLLGNQAGYDQVDASLPSSYPLRIQCASQSGLRCLRFSQSPKPSPSQTPRPSLLQSLKPSRQTARKHTAVHASTSRKASAQGPAVTEAALEDEQAPMSFWDKVVAAFEIFFPPAQVQEAPRQHAKQRLRMILVADRCSVSPTSVSQIKKAIVESLSNFVEIEQEDKVDLNITTDPNLGTIYSVSVPVRRVKPEFDIQSEYENKEFYFDSDGEQIRPLDVTFEELQQEISGANMAAAGGSKSSDPGQRRRGPVLPENPSSDGRGPPEGPT